MNWNGSLTPHPVTICREIFRTRSLTMKKYLIEFILIVLGVLAIIIPQIPSEPIVINLEEIEVEKTLDSEIDRLAIKYDVSSSTVRAIAKCESSLYGDVVNYNRRADGTIWSIDKGYLQINNYYHEARMNHLGLDWDNEWDSLEYGFMLMAEQGLQPWSASRNCWKNKI